MDCARKSLSVKSDALVGGGDSIFLAPRGLGDAMEDDETMKKDSTKPRTEGGKIIN